MIRADGPHRARRDGGGGGSSSSGGGGSMDGKRVRQDGETVNRTLTAAGQQVLCAYNI
jgi:hypothetical protein